VESSDEKDFWCSEHGSAFPRISAQTDVCIFEFSGVLVCYWLNAAIFRQFLWKQSYFCPMDTRSLSPYDHDVHQLSDFSESHVVALSHVWQTGELLHWCEIFVSLIWSGANLVERIPLSTKLYPCVVASVELSEPFSLVFVFYPAFSLLLYGSQIRLKRWKCSVLLRHSVGWASFN